MKIKIELDIADDVNYEEIEELDTMSELFDNLDEDLDEELNGWIGEGLNITTIDGPYIDSISHEERVMQILDRYNEIDDKMVKYVTYGDIGGEVKNEIMALFKYVVHGTKPYYLDI